MFFEIHSFKIYGSTGSMMSILAGKANSFIEESTFSAKGVFIGLRRLSFLSRRDNVAVVAEWYRCRTVACFVTGSSPVPLKTHRVGQRCTLNLSRAETSSRWCGS
ncbi:uncharacterized protein TNCV_1316561 [Trichonephila clavipes]|nr:uncharacterized protein TNCV_1316561 [Trichonephila clavipes]